jgi:hypothetical protein
MSRPRFSRTTTKLAAALAVAAFCAVTSALASITLANDGVGYIRPTIIPPSGLSVSDLNGMISVFNSGVSAAPYIIDKGTSTPATLLLALSLNSEITPSALDGYGQPTATVHLGTGGGQYLIAQWDGPNGADAVYYIAGLSGNVTIVNDLPGVDSHGTPLSNFGLSGYWVAVPEPNTFLAGALLLLPFGVSAVGILRNRRA